MFHLKMTYFQGEKLSIKIIITIMKLSLLKSWKSEKLRVGRCAQPRLPQRATAIDSELWKRLVKTRNINIMTLEPID